MGSVAIKAEFLDFFFFLFVFISFSTAKYSIMNIVPENIVCGPLLRYIETDYEKGVWHGSCLIVINSAIPPTLLLSIDYPLELTIEPKDVELLDVYRYEYFFWRYTLVLPLVDRAQCVSYTVDCIDQMYQFCLPAMDESMRFMFYSCNGFSSAPESVFKGSYEKEVALWQDVLDKHEKNPFHVLLGGGDQLYQDSLISEEFMKPWVHEKDPSKRISMQLSNEMKEGIEQYYFFNYIKHFGYISVNTRCKPDTYRV